MAAQAESIHDQDQSMEVEAGSMHASVWLMPWCDRLVELPLMAAHRRVRQLTDRPCDSLPSKRHSRSRTGNDCVPILWPVTWLLLVKDGYRSRWPLGTWMDRRRDRLPRSSNRSAEHHRDSPLRGS